MKGSRLVDVLDDTVLDTKFWNGIFFIPIASIMIAGFFTKHISAIAAKISLFVGLLFYINVTFIFESDIHFVHVWGIEFVLNMFTMYVLSYIFPHTKKIEIKNENQTSKR